MSQGREAGINAVIVGHEGTAWLEQRALEQEQQMGLDTEASVMKVLKAQLGNGGRQRVSEPGVTGWKQRFRNGNRRAKETGRRLATQRPIGLSTLSYMPAMGQVSWVLTLQPSEQ